MDARRPILVVDDDDDIRDTVAVALEMSGYLVDTAEDGVEAFRRLSDGLRPSVILLDMMMPRMDGESFIVALRGDPKLAGIPVVLISGHTAARHKASELHADGCLVKPIELDDLIDTVHRFAGSASDAGPASDRERA
jgi:CheY-like chemotaxis protein